MEYGHLKGTFVTRAHHKYGVEGIGGCLSGGMACCGLGAAASSWHSPQRRLYHLLQTAYSYISCPQWIVYARKASLQSSNS